MQNDEKELARSTFSGDTVAPRRTTGEVPPTAPERATHTPGPWRVVDWVNGHPTRIEVGYYDLPLCRMVEWDNPEWQAANAHLIAAAPELLDAAKPALFLIETFVQGREDVAELLRAAIAKAEGRQ